MIFIPKKKQPSNLEEESKCSMCKNNIDHTYKPMPAWNMEGLLCSKCYSKKISEYYPGTHERVNKSN